MTALATALAGAPALADEDAGKPERLSEERALAPRLYDELFETELPGQYEKGDWSLRLSPKLGDFLDDNYVRLLGGARYSFSNYFDASSELGAYFPNPFKDGDHTGLYLWRTGARYTWHGVANSPYNVAAGVNTDLPVSDAPEEVSDGYARHSPYVSAGRRLARHPDWMPYLNLTYEMVENSPFGVEGIGPHPRDRLFVRPGVIRYDGGNFRYSLELEYRTNALHFRGTYPDATPLPPGGSLENRVLASETVHEVLAYPGVTWFPTRKFQDGLRLPGSWDLGMRVKVPILEETGQDFGVSVRFRWYYDYRRMLREQWRELINRTTNRNGAK